MTNWPDKPLIRIIRGEEDAFPIYNTLATRDGDRYIVASGSRAGNPISRDYATDHIFEWEEVTAVPTAALKHLRDVFLGVELPLTQFAAIQQVVSYLPADKPSALDQAVTDAKNTGARGILEDFSLNDRIALLLAAVNRVHVGEDRRYRLAWLVRLAYTWADLEDPSKDALQSICNRAGTEVGRCGGDLVTLARQAGDVAARASEKRSLRPALIAIGGRALAWAAEIIEEEDRGDD